jgi:hypothetical protein
LRNSAQYIFRNRQRPIMSAITGFSGVGILPFLYQSAPKPSAAIEAIAREVDSSGTSSASATTATQPGSTASVLTGFTAAPKLSADVIDALLKSQAQQSAGSTSESETSDKTTNLSGISAAASDNSAPSDATSGPQTLQTIAKQFDLHGLTHQQEEQLQGELVSSGAISQKDGLTFFSKTVLSDWFDSQHYRIINGQLVATTPSAPGTLIGNDPPGGPQYDVIQRFQQSLAFDQSVGDSANAAKDQKILDMLTKLDAIRNGGTA